MPSELTTDQIEDIREIRSLCVEFNTDFVIIGAIAYKLHFPDEDRFTSDIDTVIALDSDEFVDLHGALKNSAGNEIRSWNTVGAAIADRISTFYLPVPNCDGRSKSFGLKASSS